MHTVAFVRNAMRYACVYGNRKEEENAGIRIPGVVRVLGCVGVAFGPPTTLDVAGLYALRSDPPRGRVLLPPT